MAKPLIADSPQCRMMDGALRQEGNAEVAVEQSQEIVHRADLVRLLGDDAERLEGLRQRACQFAAGADEDALLLEPARVDLLLARQGVLLVHDELEPLLEQRPRVEPRPVLPQRAGDGEIGPSLLQALVDLGGIAAQEGEVQTGKGALHLGQRADQQPAGNAVRNGERQGLRGALLE